MEKLLAAGLGLLLVGAMLLPPAYPDRPPAAHTGGFGEPTCHRCHFDYPLDEPGGTLALEGLPGTYEPGRRYVLRLVLARPGLQAGGFELAARFPDGVQAGVLAPEDGAAVQDSAGVRYLHHTKPGTVPAAPDTAAWTFVWEAPAAGGAEVVFHAVANAADGDASAFGDVIHTLERRVPAPDR